MYVDTQVRPQGELVDAVAPAKLKLSEAIRIGARHVEENRNHWGCAMGAACYATGLLVTMDNFLEIGGGPGMKRHLVEKTSASEWLCTEVSARHYCGQSRESIADWLEAQGL